MKTLFKFCLLFFLFFSIINTVSAACPVSGADGGLCIDYKDATGVMFFVEDSVYQFRFEFFYADYEKLLDEYRKDSLNNPGKYLNYKIAGLGFVPIITHLTTSTPTQIHYETTGIKVVLVLWEGMVISGQNAPNKIELFGYGDLGHAFTFQRTSHAPGAPEHIKELTTPITNSQVKLSNDPMVHATQEFEIVFLSMADFEYLATSDGFYSPPSPAQGITIERAFSTIEPSQSATGMTHYRTLLFKPLPEPNSQSYPSEASVAYRNGEYCPPYWVDPTEDNFCADKKGDCFLEAMIKKQPVMARDTIYIREPGEGGPFVDKLRWDWMAMIIAAVLALFFGVRALVSNQG